MHKTIQFPPVRFHKMVHRFALFAAVLAWGAPAAAQSYTGWPLAGVHLTQTCKTCHVNNVYKGTARDCYTCHKTAFTASVNPPHAASGFPTTCDTCHKFSDAAWKPASFNHSTNTTFPLAGVHATQACTICHVNNVYKGTARTCAGCHMSNYAKNYNNSKNPPHLAGGFSTTCDTCHLFSAAAWSPATFNHSTATTFPLAGVHTTQACTTCHKNNVYKGTARTCAGCHQTDYNNAKTPVDHIASNFPTTCDSCHKFSDATWMGATFSHSTFPLVGVHKTTACATCHNPPYAPSANNYTTVPTTCYGCHIRDFTSAAAALPVPHVGFPTTCDSCHKNTDTTWAQKGSFVHNSYWTLSGAHATAACTKCHNPPYAKKANDYISLTTSPCSGCHMQDYTTATTPVNHITAGYPTTCDLCHKFTDATWLVATAFTHTAFPMRHGNASVCADCHTTPGQFLSPYFSCTGCHGKTQMDSKHKGRSGYSYVSTACYACHPRGNS